MQPLDKAREVSRLKREDGPIEIRTPIEKWADGNQHSLRMSINAYCFGCSNEQKQEITNCSLTKCHLFQVRPYQKKTTD